MNDKADFVPLVRAILAEYGGYVNAPALAVEFPLYVDPVGEAHEFIVPFSAFRTVLDLVDITNQLKRYGSLPASTGRPGSSGACVTGA